MGKRIYRQPSEETRIKMSEAKKGDKNYNFGREQSLETRLKISLALKQYWQKIPNKPPNLDDK